MEKNNENSNSQNGENDIVVEENDDVGVLKEKFEKVTTSNRQLFERAKKAETEAKELREFKTKADVEAKAKADAAAAKMPEKPNESDYKELAKLAYLHSQGLQESDDIKLVDSEAERLKLPLNEILGMDHIKTKLQKNKEIREAKAGMPEGGNRAGSGGKGDVDYWLAKGGLPSDQKLAEKVVDARMERESDNKFADSMFSE